MPRRRKPGLTLPERAGLAAVILPYAATIALCVWAIIRNLH